MADHTQKAESAAPELPPLPKPARRSAAPDFIDLVDYYTAEQVRQAQREAVAADRQARAPAPPTRGTGSQHNPASLPARRFVSIKGFWDADYVEFAEGCTHGGGVLNDVQHSKHYTRRQAESYVKEGAWREVAVPHQVGQKGQNNG